MAQAVDQVLQAIATLQAPTSQVQQRKDATLFLEQVKKGDVHVLLGVGGTLVGAPNIPAEVKVVGYTLLTDLVRARWSELADMEKAQLSQLSYNQATAVCSEGRSARPLKGKAAVLLSVLIRQQGGDAYAEVVPRLLQQASTGPAQAELACMVLHYISEDLTFFDVREGLQGDNKRLFLAALTGSVPVVFPFLCESLQQHFIAALAAQQEGSADNLAVHSAVIHAALGALSTWVEWTPMARIAASNVLDACTFFLTAPDFRLPALDVLKQMVARKRTTEAWPEYSGLMDKLATQLIARATEMGLMVAPPWWLPQGLSQDLDYGGDLEEVGRRLCGLVVGLTESHMRCMATQERRTQLLQLLLVFTSHPYLVLSASTLSVWAQLVREAGPAGATSTGNNAALHGMTQGAIAEVLGVSGSGPVAVTPLVLLPEVCQVLLQVMWQLLSKVVGAMDGQPVTGAGPASGPAADASGPGTLSPSASSRELSASGLLATMPAYFDTAQEWKEFCITTRGQIKTVLRGAAQMVPAQVFSLTQQVLSSAMSGAVTALAGYGLQNPAPAHVVAPLALALDCAVHVAEAAVPILVDASATQPVLLQELETLLGGVMAVRFTTPRLAVLHARCLEAFGRLLTVRPELAAPMVTAALEAMLAIPMSTPGQDPPPARISREWKHISEARLALANSVTQFAKVAPLAFAPHLRLLADQVAAMWDAGKLAEGERVLLWEGLLAAAAGVSSTVAGQLVGWLLAPVAATWSDPAWQARLSSPQAFQQAFLPVESTGPTSTSGNGTTQQIVIGARAERWALYHQLTLLERAMRRTAPPPARLTSASQQQQGGEGGPLARAGSPPPTLQAGSSVPFEYPMDPHLKWCLPPLAAMMQCVHGLAAADAAGVLGPLQGICAVDEIEKAVRLVGEEVGTSAGGREGREPRCVAGGSVADARYMLRGLREAGSMAISLAAMHGSVQALWSDEGLAAALTGPVSSNLQFLDHNHMRLLIRHVANQFCARCPARYQTMWLLPLLAAYLPHMAQRLSEGWAANSAATAATATAAAGGGGQPGAAAGKEGRTQQDVDEVVGDVMLREVTREHMALLVTITQRPGSSMPVLLPPQAGAVPVGTRKGGGSPKAASDASGSAAAAALERNPPGSQPRGPGGASGGARPLAPRMSNHGTGPLSGGAGEDGEAGLRETPFVMLMTHRPELAQVMVSTAISGLCWPDTDAAQRAIATCRFIVAYGLREGGVMADAVVGPLLQAAVVALTQPSTTSIQGELLAVLRALIAGSLAVPSLAPRVRGTLLSLLQVSPAVLNDFEAQLAARGGEKEQRAAIRQLVAQAGGEEVRKILDVVTRLPGPLVAVTEPRPHQKQRTDKATADGDAVLQGAIYNHIFAPE